MTKNTIFFILIATVIVTHVAAQSKSEKQVTVAVQQLSKAMIDADKTVLENLVSDQLSYGHSGGHIDDKKEFVEKLVSGKSDFITIELFNQTILVTDKTAIVRHDLNAKTNDNGIPNDVHLHILLVWQKFHGTWKLLARQAVKK